MKLRVALAVIVLSILALGGWWALTESEDPPASSPVAATNETSPDAGSRDASEPEWADTPSEHSSDHPATPDTAPRLVWEPFPDTDEARAAVYSRCPVMLAREPTKPVPLPSGANDAADRLNAAYDQQSMELLDEFLAHWARDVQPVDPGTIAGLPEVARATYELYADVYNDEGLGLLGGFSYNDRPGIGTTDAQRRLVVVPNTVYLMQLDDLEERVDYFGDEGWRLRPEPEVAIRFGCLDNFRPPLDLADRTPLYLTAFYEAAISRHLGYDAESDGPDSRLDFLNRRLTVIPFHWGGGWHVDSHPKFWTVKYNVALNLALINYQIEYSHCEAVARRAGDSWSITKKGNCGYE